MAHRDSTLAMLLAAATCLLAATLPARAAGPPPVIVLQGHGVQVYACAATASGFAWHLTGPDARLVDAAGREVGRHFAGPTWQANDGSEVVGEPIAVGASPAGAIPWLVLRAKAHRGAGLFASVTYVVRSQTVGGQAPATGCDRGHAGAQVRVPYDATYSLFRGPAGAPP